MWALENDPSHSTEGTYSAGTAWQKTRVPLLAREGRSTAIKLPSGITVSVGRLASVQQPISACTVCVTRGLLCKSPRFQDLFWYSKRLACSGIVRPTAYVKISSDVRS